jgi:hypothetical protein
VWEVQVGGTQSKAGPGKKHETLSKKQLKPKGLECGASGTGLAQAPEVGFFCFQRERSPHLAVSKCYYKTQNEICKGLFLSFSPTFSMCRLTSSLCKCVYEQKVVQERLLKELKIL